jgi:hypothetical protein
MKPILAVCSSLAMLYATCYDSMEILCGVLPSGSIVLSHCNGLLIISLDKGPIMLRVFPGFSFDQHQLTGQQIYNTREFFGKLHYDLLESYGESARPVRLVEEIVERIDRLINNLGEVVCTENPDREDWELDQCYYSVSD